MVQRTSAAPVRSIFQMDDQKTDWIDELARRSPTALAMALERAIQRHDRDLERAVLEALTKVGIIVFDRASLVEAIGSLRQSRQPMKGQS